PEETVLFAIVRDHLEPFLAHARETYECGLPRYVEQAFRGYLTCGVFAHGFLRYHCDDCQRDLLVPFSCKGRGICPSSGARRIRPDDVRLVESLLSLPYGLLDNPVVPSPGGDALQHPSVC